MPTPTLYRDDGRASAKQCCEVAVKEIAVTEDQHPHPPKVIFDNQSSTQPSDFDKRRR